MVPAGDLSRLLLLLYEGVSSPGRMREFLQAILETTNAKGAILREHSYSVRGEEACVGTSNFSETVGYSDDALAAYSNYFYTNDIYLNKVLEGFSDADCGASQVLVTKSELGRSEIYSDYLVPFDIGPMMWAKLAATPGYHSSLSVVRGDGKLFFDQPELALLTALAPHLRQALHLNKTLSALNSSNAMLSRGVEDAGIAICTVRQDGTVLRSTAGADQVLAAKDALWLQDRQLRTTVRSEQAALDQLIFAAAQTGGNKGLANARRVKSVAAGSHTIQTWTANAGGALLITRRLPLRPLQVIVSPFCPGTLLNDPEATALVQFSDPSATPRPRAAVLRALYGLTPTESRLADFLLQGSDVREAADRLGTTLETARFHLKRVLAKTGTSRQTALMRLLLSLPGMP